MDNARYCSCLLVLLHLLQLAVREYGGLKQDPKDTVQADAACDEDIEFCDPRFRGSASLSQYSSVLDSFLEEQRAEQEILERYGGMPKESLRAAREARAGAKLPAGEVSAGPGEASGGALAGLGAKMSEDGLKGDVREGESGEGGKEEEEESEEEEDEDEFVVEEDGSRAGEVWDCESIVSTYSNTENHPALIGAPPARRRRAQGSSDGQGALHEDNTVAIMGGGVQPLALVGRHRLPEGYGGKSERSEKGGERSDKRSDDKKSGKKSGDGAGGPGVPLVRRKGETAEEKKARKVRLPQHVTIRRRARPCTVLSIALPPVLLIPQSWYN